MWREVHADGFVVLAGGPHPASPAARQADGVNRSGPRDEWTVQIKSANFGVYCVHGPIHRSVTTGELRIGLALITESRHRPAKRVLGIWPGGPELLDAVGKVVSPKDVNHGAIVRAQVNSFGDVLTILGHAVGQKRNDLLGVGHHTIRTPEGGGKNLLSLTEVEGVSAGAPYMPYSWADIDDASNQFLLPPTD